MDSNVHQSNPGDDEIEMAKLKLSKVKTLEDPALKIYKTFLKYGGIYIKSDLIFRIYSRFVILLDIIVLTLMFISFYVFADDIDKFATVAHHLMFVIDMIGGVSIFSYYRHEIIDLVDAANDSFEYYSEITAQNMRETEEKRRRQIDIAIKLIAWTTFGVVAGLTLAAYFEQYISDEKVLLMFPLWFPFDIDSLINYLMAFSIQYTAVVIAVLIVFGTLAFIYLVYNHVKSELQFLKFAIAKTFERAEEMVKSNKQSDLTIEEAYVISVRHCAAHHVEILKYFERGNNVLQLIYIFVFGTGLGLLVSAGIVLLSDNTVLKIKFLTVTIIQLVFIFICCWLGEEIGTQSEGINEAIYDIAWYDLPKECHTIFYIMAERGKKPLSFTTPIGMKANLDTYMTITKAAYSYFNMILASQER